MKSIHDFIVKPIEGRYNNTVKVGDTDLIVNTRIEEFKSVSKVAEVVALPLSIKTDIKVGDKVIVHHNVFRSSMILEATRKTVEVLLKKICMLVHLSRYICMEQIRLILIIAL